MNEDDKITSIKKALNKFTKHYEELKAVGINQEILEAYLITKTKLPRKTIKSILNSQKEFYDNLITTAAVEAL